MKLKIVCLVLLCTSNLAFASEAAFTATADKLRAVKTTKEREQILFDFYAELNKMIAEIEKKEDPSKDENYTPLLESLVFYEIVMDRHNAVKLTENRSCKDYKYYIDARIDPQAENGVPEDKYPAAAKWFQILIKPLCK
jgi:uncharacterized protein YdcH (DUF465 family)